MTYKGQIGWMKEQYELRAALRDLYNKANMIYIITKTCWKRYFRLERFSNYVNENTSICKVNIISKDTYGDINVNIKLIIIKK